jgi:hypothetical protein
MKIKIITHVMDMTRKYVDFALQPRGYRTRLKKKSKFRREKKGH